MVLPAAAAPAAVVLGSGDLVEALEVPAVRVVRVALVALEATNHYGGFQVGVLKPRKSSEEGKKVVSREPRIRAS